MIPKRYGSAAFRGATTWAALLAGLMLASPAAHGQSDFTGDIVCLSNRTPSLLPGVCEKKCPAHATLANLNALNCGGVNGATCCDLKARTPALAGDEDMRYHYDRAVWGKILGGRRIPPAPPHPVLVAHIIDRYYPPYKYSTFDVGFGPSPEHWAGLEQPGAGSSKPSLTIEDDLFWCSPAFLVSVLGHEMVHMDQFQRHYTTSRVRINDVVKAMSELEASSWELQRDKFPRTFKAHGMFPYMQELEQKEEEVNYECDQWDVRKAIEDVVTGPRGQVYSVSLGAWFREDPWASQVWLPQNPDWATQHAGPRPASCKAN